MGIASFPSVASPIKSIQRGSAASAGSITIAAVRVSRTTVSSFSTGASGTVAATGTVASGTSNMSGYASKFGFNATLGAGGTTEGQGGSTTVPRVDLTNTEYAIATYNAQTPATYNTFYNADGYNASIYTPGNFVPGNYSYSTYNARYGGSPTYYNPPFSNSPTFTPSYYIPSNVSGYAITSYNANTANYNTFYLAKPVTGSITNAAVSITGGTTNLTSAVNGAYLQDSTTLVVTGPCRYEVVEYY